MQADDRCWHLYVRRPEARLWILEFKETPLLRRAGFADAGLEAGLLYTRARRCWILAKVKAGQEVF